MKIKSSAVLKVLVFIFLLIKINFFYLFDVEYKYIYPFLGFLICTLYPIIFMKSDFKSFIVNYKVLFRYIVIVYFSVFILIIYTSAVFPGQNLSNTIYLSYPFMSIVFSVPIIILMEKASDENVMFRMLNIVACIWYIILLVQYINYAKSGTIILQHYFSYGTITRNGMIRIDLQDFGNIMIVFNVYSLFTTKAISKKILHGIISSLGIFELIVIEQTRMYSLLILLSITVIIITLGENGKHRFIKKLVVGVLVFLIIISSDIVQMILASFSITGTDSISTINRFYAIKYYCTYFIRHPIFGFAFAHSEVYPYIVRGNENIASISDVGLFGLIVRLGIFIFPIVGFYIYRISKLRMHLKNRMSNKQFALYNSIYFYLIFSFISLSIFDQSRWLLYPFLISLFEVENFWINGQTEN